MASIPTFSPMIPVFRSLLFRVFITIDFSSPSMPISSASGLNRIVQLLPPSMNATVATASPVVLLVTKQGIVNGL